MGQNPFHKVKRKTLPWNRHYPALDTAIERLTNTWFNKKTKRPDLIRLGVKDQQSLKRLFKDAEQARSAALKFMIHVSKAIGSLSPESAVELADMKEWMTAAEKFSTAKRSTDDLGRGRIYLRDVDSYHAFIALMSSKDTDGHLDIPGGQKISIVPDSMSDYIASPRDNGYAGSINFNLSVVHRGGREGRFEAQVIPEDYRKVYDHSHCLYDMIRILTDQVAVEYQTKEDKLIKEALILSNAALFAEHSARYGFDKITRFRGLKVTQKDLETINNILDKIRNAIEQRPGRNFKWKQDMMTAITYTKTSVMQAFLSQPDKVKNSAPVLIFDHT